MFTTKTFFAFAALATASLTAHSASAGQPDTDLVTAKVAYGDLNLNSPAGAQVLAARVNHAIVQVCGDARGAIDLAFVGRVHACARQARDQVVTTLDNPMVTAMLNGGAKASGVVMASR